MYIREYLIPFSIVSSGTSSVPRTSTPGIIICWLPNAGNTTADGLSVVADTVTCTCWPINISIESILASTDTLAATDKHIAFKTTSNSNLLIVNLFV